MHSQIAARAHAAVANPIPSLCRRAVSSAYYACMHATCCVAHTALFPQRALCKPACSPCQRALPSLSEAERRVSLTDELPYAPSTGARGTARHQPQAKVLYCRRKARPTNPLPPSAQPANAEAVRELLLKEHAQLTDSMLADRLGEDERRPVMRVGGAATGRAVKGGAAIGTPSGGLHTMEYFDMVVRLEVLQVRWWLGVQKLMLRVRG